MWGAHGILTISVAFRTAARLAYIIASAKNVNIPHNGCERIYIKFPETCLFFQYLFLFVHTRS